MVDAGTAERLSAYARASGAQGLKSLLAAEGLLVDEPAPSHVFTGTLLVQVNVDLTADTDEEALGQSISMAGNPRRLMERALAREGGARFLGYSNGWAVSRYSGEPDTSSEE